jgi:hypothetical protein
MGPIVRTERAFLDLVDSVDISSSITKLYDRKGKRISQQALANYAKTQKQVVVDWLKEMRSDKNSVLFDKAQKRRG